MKLQLELWKVNGIDGGTRIRYNRSAEWEHMSEELMIGGFAQGLTTLPELCKYEPENAPPYIDVLVNFIIEGKVAVLIQ